MPKCQNCMNKDEDWKLTKKSIRPSVRNEAKSDTPCNYPNRYKAIKRIN